LCFGQYFFKQIQKKVNDDKLSKDANLKDYYNAKLPDIDLLFFKEDCMNLPYERLGSQVMRIFRENFKIIKLFLASISSLLYSHDYAKELFKEIDTI